MFVAIVTMKLRLPSRTLKEKRAIVRSAIERAQHRFNATVAEVDDLDTPMFATIAAAVLSNDAQEARRQAEKVAVAIEDWRPDAEFLAVETEVVSL